MSERVMWNSGVSTVPDTVRAHLGKIVAATMEFLILAATLEGSYQVCLCFPNFLSSIKTLR